MLPADAAAQAPVQAQAQAPAQPRAQAPARAQAPDLAEVELRVPAPLPEPPRPFLAVGGHGPASVDAEDFARRLGNWGNASRLIGERWETLAPELLRRRLPWRVSLGAGHTATVQALLALDADKAIGSVLQRAGVSAPDLLLVGVAGDRAFVGAADCKVSLDTADREQTAPARLQLMFSSAARDHPQVGEALVAQLDLLPDAERERAGGVVRAALAGEWQQVLVGEGQFVAPDNGFNRWFLARLEDRRRTGAPLGRMPVSGPRRSGADVKGPVDALQAARLQLPSHLEAVSAADFLASVPGWQEARLVTQLDRLDLGKVDLAVAERCWRVGVGLRGAVVALKRRLFHNALPIDTDEVDVDDVLRQVVRRRRPEDSGALVAALAQFVAGRRPLWDREAALLRPPVTFSAWSVRAGEALRAAARGRSRNGAAPRGAGSRGAGRAGPSTRALYRELTRAHVTRVAQLARSLEAEGLQDAVLLDALEARAGELAAACEGDADALSGQVAGTHGAQVG